MAELLPFISKKHKKGKNIFIEDAVLISWSSVTSYYCNKAASSWTNNFILLIGTGLKPYWPSVYGHQAISFLHLGKLSQSCYPPTWYSLNMGQYLHGYLPLQQRSRECVVQFQTRDWHQSMCRIQILKLHATQTERWAVVFQSLAAEQLKKFSSLMIYHICEPQSILGWY